MQGCDALAAVQHALAAIGVDGATWTVELTGLPAPHRSARKRIESLANELGAKYRPAEERPSGDIAAIPVDQSLAEPGRGWWTFPPPPQPVIALLAPIRPANVVSAGSLGLCKFER